MFFNSEEHRAVFAEPPVTACRYCKNPNDILVKARPMDKNLCYEKGCSQMCINIYLR